MNQFYRKKFLVLRMKTKVSISQEKYINIGFDWLREPLYMLNETSFKTVRKEESGDWRKKKS